MELHRLTPASLEETPSGLRGRCAACDQPLDYSERIIHMYGERFHHGCAFYRSRDGAQPQTADGQR
jgi:hypothetical protein